jgi:Tol biopolymer transport system component
LTIAAGTRLGPYEVLSRIGAGGMGEVYRARDTRLGRDVAIKVLPPGSASREDVRARFEREARAISALNDPRICTLHDIGTEGEVAYIVMELIDGETLASRLSRGRLPFEVAMKYAIEIAIALDLAHKHGIAHRDLKPGNIMITRSGIKLLDFGLARLQAKPIHGPDASTAINPITEEGTVIGTLQYMAPEQLEGKTVDARADIFAFGCIVYEMATGRRAFEGSSQASIISAIMTSDPPAIASLVPITPPSLDRIVRKSLAKSPEDRWQCAGDLATELQWIAESPQIAAAQPRKSSKLAWILAALATAAAIGIALVLPPRASRPPLLRAAIGVDGVALTGDWMQGRASLSPDGRSIAFAGEKDGTPMIFVRSLDEQIAKPVPNTEGVNCGPVWSPDSQQIAFVGSAGKLVRATIDGREAATICEISPTFATYTWGHDGTIVLAEFDAARGLFQVPASGGQRRPVNLPASVKGKRVFFPHFIGESRTLTYVTMDKGADLQLHAFSLDSNEDRDLGPIDSRVQIVDSTLFFVRDGLLFAQRVDDNLKKIGDPVLVASDVRYNLAIGAGAFHVSPTGIAYINSITDAQMTWFDRHGVPEKSVGPIGAEGQPRLSPDGRYAVVSATDRRYGSGDLWVCDLQHDTMIQLTSGRLNDASAEWSPDGKRIAYITEEGGAPHVMMIPASGGDAITVTPPSVWQAVTSWSPDGKNLLIVERTGGKRAIYTVAPHENSTPVPWLNTAHNEGGLPRYSHDGKWIAYQSNISGKNEIFISPVNDPIRRLQVSRGGGHAVAWRGDDRELYYMYGDSLYVVQLKAQPNLEASAPQLLFRAAADERWRGFDVDAKGERFLIVRTRSGPSSGPIHLIVNWKQLLEKKR